MDADVVEDQRGGCIDYCSVGYDNIGPSVPHRSRVAVANFTRMVLLHEQYAA